MSNNGSESGDALVQQLSEQGADVVRGAVSPFDNEAVLVHAMERVTDDLRVVVDFGEARRFGPDGRSVLYPLSATAAQQADFIRILDGGSQIGGAFPRGSTNDVNVIVRHHPLFSNYIAALLTYRFQKDAEPLIQAVAGHNFDSLYRDNAAFRESYDEAANTEGGYDDEHKRALVLESFKEERYVLDSLRTLGWATRDAEIMLKKYGSLDKVLRLYRRVFSVSRTARYTVMRSLREYLLYPEAQVAMSIARQGSRRLRDIEAMTDYEWWQHLYDSKEKERKKNQEILEKTRPDKLMETLPAALEAVREARDGMPSVDELTTEPSDDGAEPQADLGAWEPARQILSEFEPTDVVSALAERVGDLIREHGDDGVMLALETHLGTGDEEPGDPREVNIVFDGVDEHGLRTIETGSDEQRQLDRREDVEVVTLELPDAGDIEITESIPLDEDAYKTWKKAREYLDTHKPSEEIPRLREVLECDKHAAKLAELREGIGSSEFNLNRLAAYEKMVCELVYAELVSYPYADDFDEAKQHMSYIAGSPLHAVEQKSLNCFSGPWLMSEMLQQCGIPYEQILYCNAYEYPDSRYGTHGGLVVTTCLRENWVYDWGGKRDGHMLRMGMLEPGSKRDVTQLLNQLQNAREEDFRILITRPPKLEVPKDMAAKVDIYSHAHLMPPDQGFAANHMLNTGISFMSQGKTVEAKRAYEIGLALFPSSPDLLCRYGMLLLQEGGDDETAEEYFHEALRQYPGHLDAQYGLGICALRADDEDEALKRFEIIRSDAREIWGDRTFADNASAYVKHHQQLQDAFRGSQVSRQFDVRTD